MASLTCTYSACPPPTTSWKEAAAVQEHQEVVAEEVAAACDQQAWRTTKDGIISRKRGEEEGEGPEEVWEGVVTREIGAGAEEVWEMMGKFGDMKRWNRAVEVCELVEGEEGKVGCVRYCTGGDRWIKEKLLALHPTQRRVTYTMIDSSYGFQGYFASIAVSPLLPGRCLVQWTFRLDPVPHLPQDKLLSFFTTIFDRMMASLEQTILSASSSSLRPPPPPPLATNSDLPAQ